MPIFMAEDLRPLGIAILCGAGATVEEAGLVIAHAIDSLLSGEENHGSDLGTQYIPPILEGILHAGTPYEILKESPTTLLVDGHMNFGHYVSHHVMTRLIEKAKVSQIAAASIRYQGHVGRLMDYTSMAARAGMISLMMCDGGGRPKLLSPFGGIDRRMGVNPFSMAVPSNTPDGYVGFDMTSGSVSMMKVQKAAALGESIPEGWILDKEGKPTTDPNAYAEGGSALPFGGINAHKGYAIGFMIEIMANIVSGMEHRPEPTKHWPVIDGSFMFVCNVEAFRPLADFTYDLDDFIDWVKSSRIAEGSPGVYYPGERSEISRQRRRVEGVEIPEYKWYTICDYAKQYGLEQLIPAAIGKPS